MKIKTIDDLNLLKEKYYPKINKRLLDNEFEIQVYIGDSGYEYGMRAILKIILEAIDDYHLKYFVKVFDEYPDDVGIIRIIDDNDTYYKVSLDNINEIIDNHLLKHKIVEKYLLEVK